MRALTTFIGLASVALAQVDISNLPQCAYGCVTNLGDCNSLDVQCICSDSELISGLACCVSTSCDSEDQDGQ